MISPINFTQTTDFWIFSRSTVDEVMLSPFFFVPLPFPRGLAARQGRGRHGAPFPLEIVGLIPWGQQDQDMTNAPNPFILGRSGTGNPAALGRAPVDITVDHLYSDSTVDNTAPKI